MSADLQPVTRNNWQEMIQLTEFPLDFSSRDVPLFFQIYQLFKEEILHNHIQYNDLLPSELLELGRNKGVKVYGTSRYWFQRKRQYPTVLLGYGTLSQQQIRQGIRLLAEAWFS